MVRIKSITVRKSDVRAPVYIQGVIENGQKGYVKFKAAEIGIDRVKFVRTEECTSGLERRVN